MLGTSDAWSVSRLSHHPSDPHIILKIVGFIVWWVNLLTPLGPMLDATTWRDLYNIFVGSSTIVKEKHYKMMM